MPDTFLFAFPELTLENSEEKGEPIELISQYQFHIILAQSCSVTHIPSLTAVQCDYLKNCLIKIWDMDFERFQPKRLYKEYKAFFAQKHVLAALINIIIVSRNQSIKVAKKTRLGSEKEQVEFLIDMRDRVLFMHRIIPVLGQALYSSALTTEYRRDFLKGLFNDMEVWLINGSSNLANQKFLTNYETFLRISSAETSLTIGCSSIDYKNSLTNNQKLVQLLEEMVKLGGTLCSKINDQLDSVLQEEKLFLQKLILDTKQWPLYLAKSHFLIGNDEEACSYLTQVDSLSDDLYPEARLKKVDLEAIQSDPKRNAYAALWAQRERVDKQFACFNKDQLREAIQKNLNKLVIITEITSDSVGDFIEAAHLLHLAATRGHDQDLQTVNLCKNIIAHLQVVIKKDRPSAVVNNLWDYYGSYLIGLQIREKNIQKAQSKMTLPQKKTSESEQPLESMPKESQKKNRNNKNKKNNIKVVHLSVSDIQKKSVVKQESQEVLNMMVFQQQIDPVAEQELRTAQDQMKQLEQSTMILEQETQALEQELHKAQQQITQFEQSAMAVQQQKQALEQAKLKQMEEITQEKLKVEVLKSQYAQVEVNLNQRRSVEMQAFHSTAGKWAAKAQESEQVIGKLQSTIQEFHGMEERDRDMDGFHNMYTRQITYWKNRVENKHAHTGSMVRVITDAEEGQQFDSPAHD